MSSSSSPSKPVPPFALLKKQNPSRTHPLPLKSLSTLLEDEVDDDKNGIDSFHCRRSASNRQFDISSIQTAMPLTHRKRRQRKPPQSARETDDRHRLRRLKTLLATSRVSTHRDQSSTMTAKADECLLAVSSGERGIGKIVDRFFGEFFLLSLSGQRQSIIGNSSCNILNY
jgi:hypothetical protein